MSNRNKINKEIERFIGIEHDIESELDALDDENPESPREGFELVTYSPVESKMPIEQRQTDIYDDYEYTRTVLRGLIERGVSALEGSLMLAKESEHPRAFEVTSTLMKNISDMSKDLMGLHKVMGEETNDGAGSSKPPTTQNNIQNNYYGAKEEKGIDDLLDDLEDS